MKISNLYNATAISGTFSRARKSFTASLAFQDLLNNGLNPNLRSNGGRTLLHEAVVDNKPEAVALLLAYGADANARGPGNRTPAHVAAIKGYEEILGLLAENGADLSLQDDNGWSPNRPHSAFYEAVGKPPYTAHFVPRQK